MNEIYHVIFVRCVHGVDDRYVGGYVRKNCLFIRHIDQVVIYLQLLSRNILIVTISQYLLCFGKLVAVSVVLHEGLLLLLSLDK